MRRIVTVSLLAMICVAGLHASEKNTLRRGRSHPSLTWQDPAFKAKVDNARSVTVTGTDVALPFLFDGDGYRSQVRLTNLDTADVTFELLFVDDNGAPTAVPLADGSSPTSVKGTVPALGMTTILTAGVATRTQIFWGYVNSPSIKLGVMATLDEDFDGDFLGVTYPASNIGAQKVIGPYDNVEADTQVSVISFNTSSVVVTAITRDESGKELFREDFTMDPMTATGYYPSDVSDATVGTRGTVEFSVPSGTKGGLCVVGTRFYDAGAFDNLPSVALP